jgi:hypothetical protein
MMVIGVVAFSILVLIIFGLSVVAYRDRKEGERMILKLIYTFLIGIFLAVFVGVGISAFYHEPKFPEQPVILKYCSPDMIKDATQGAEFTSQIAQFDKEEKSFQEKSQIYNRNVSIIAIIASIVIVIASLTLFQSVLLIPDGLLLGGVLSLIYGVLRGFGTTDNMFRFIVVSIGLFVSLFLGYMKFIQPAKK